MAWPRDSSHLAGKLEGQIRESVNRMHSAKSSQSRLRAVRHGDTPAPAEALSRVRSQNGPTQDNVSFAKLIEMTATGELGGDDDVALMGARDFRKIRDGSMLDRFQGSEVMQQSTFA